MAPCLLSIPQNFEKKVGSLHPKKHPLQINHPNQHTIPALCCGANNNGRLVLLRRFQLFEATHQLLGPEDIPVPTGLHHRFTASFHPTKPGIRKMQKTGGKKNRDFLKEKRATKKKMENLEILQMWLVFLLQKLANFFNGIVKPLRINVRVLNPRNFWVIPNWRGAERQK